MKNAVLQIFYTDEQGKLHVAPQGKIFKDDWGKWIYLADMTPAKWFKNFSGYAISTQILEAFAKVKIRPSICYRRRDLGVYYTATPTLFYQKGIKGSWNGHSQVALPIKNWDTKSVSKIKEPKNLPVQSVDKWIKPDVQIQFRDDGTMEEITL